MPPPLLHTIQPTSLPDYCTPTNSFLTTLSSILHICIPTPLAGISTLLGTLSIVSWLFAQLPQIYTNYQLQSTSGLSIYFLVEWCLGDTSNLIGALLTRQAGWQVVIAAYYVLVDVTLVVQYFWYTRYQRRGGVVYGAVRTSSSRRDADDGTGSVLDGVSVEEERRVAWRGVQNKADRDGDGKYMNTSVKDTSPNGSANGSYAYSSNENEKHSTRRVVARTGTSYPFGSLASTRILAITSLFCAVLTNASPTTSPNPNTTSISTTQTPREDTLEIIGRVFSWLSTALYLGSRPPQLYKNYTRKSTAGLSPLLFFAAFNGNLFYSASLATNPNAWSDFAPHGGHGWADSHGNDRIDWLSRSIPFFLGAFGVLFLDGSMGVQFLLYGGLPCVGDEMVVRVEDRGRGKKYWARVSGWMRGWIPSLPRSRRSSPDDEDRALLGGDPERESGAARVSGRYGAV